MKMMVLLIGIVFLAVIAALEIWKRLVPDRSKLVKKIEIALVILAFVGGAVGLIRKSVSPSVGEQINEAEENIKEAVVKVLEKRTVPVGELTDAYEEIGKLKDQLAKAVERAVEMEKRGDVPEAKGIIEELRKSGDVSRLLEVLVKDRDTHRDELIERNLEIAAVAYLRGDIDKATEAVEEILKLKPDDMIGLTHKGNIHRLRGELKEAEDCYQHVLELGKQAKDEVWQAAALGNLGLTYFTMGELDKAEDMEQKTLEIMKETGNLKGIASAYGNLGLVYRTMGELDKAEEMHKKALEIAEKLGMQEEMARQYGNLGLVYKARRELDKAEEMRKKSLEIAEKLELLEVMSSQYGNLGIVYRRRGELDKAEEMHKKALEIHEKLGLKEGMARDYGNLGLIYMDREELDKAEKMHKKSLDIEEKIGRLEGIANDYVNLGVVYEKRGDIAKARQYWEKAVELYKRISMPHRVEEVGGWIEGLEKR